MWAGLLFSEIVSFGPAALLELGSFAGIFGGFCYNYKIIFVFKIREQLSSGSASGCLLLHIYKVICLGLSNILLILCCVYKLLLGESFGFFLNLTVKYKPSNKNQNLNSVKCFGNFILENQIIKNYKF